LIFIILFSPLKTDCGTPKILADNFALYLKCDVWVPDFFAGACGVCPPRVDIYLLMVQAVPLSPLNK
jgi:hypothetical protein